LAKLAKDSFDSRAFLAKVGVGKSISKFSKGQNVFAQGDVADAVFYGQKGKIKLTVVSDRGKEAVVEILGPGQFFGEGCLNGHPLRIATTTAMEDCVITRISKTAMIAALEKQADVLSIFYGVPARAQ
jgi:CRP/FNR family transcriptional regulator, cyclic AMP receptor protein